MKKFLGVAVAFLMFFGLAYGISSSAEKITTIEFEAPATLKKGEKATISVNIKDATRLYGIQWNYNYNADELKVLSLTKGDMLANAPYGVMDSSGNPIEEGKPTLFFLTFTGQNDGVSGNGQVIKMEVEALKDCKLSFTTKNSPVILVDISKDFEIGNPTYTFVGTEEEQVIDPTKPPVDNGGNGGAGENTGTSGNSGTGENAENGENTGTDQKEESNETNSGNNSNENGEDDKTVATDGKEATTGDKDSSEDKNLSTSDSSVEATKKSPNNLGTIAIIAIFALAGVGGVIYYKKKQINK